MGLIALKRKKLNKPTYNMLSKKTKIQNEYNKKKRKSFRKLEKALSGEKQKRNCKKQTMKRKTKKW